MKAISIAQPWAWLVINAGMDVIHTQLATPYTGPLLIHAAKGCTLFGGNNARDEYAQGAIAVQRINPAFVLPSFERLERGGIVGAVTLTGCVMASDSPWFSRGRLALEVRDAVALPFTPLRGSPQLFKVPRSAIPMPRVRRCAEWPEEAWARTG